MKKTLDDRVYETKSVFKGVILVTPEMAKEMLDRQHGNRKLKQIVVDAYVRDMKNGTFQWNHQSMCIAVSADGNLINGQHRLMAMYLSGTTHEMFLFEEPELEEADEGIFDLTQNKQQSFSSVCSNEELHIAFSLLKTVGRTKKYTLAEKELAWKIIDGNKNLNLKGNVGGFIYGTGKKGFNTDVVIGAVFAYISGAEDAFEVIRDAKHKEPSTLKGANLRSRILEPACRKWISAKGDLLTDKTGQAYQLEYFLYLTGHNPARYKNISSRLPYYKKFQTMAYELLDRKFPRAFDVEEN